MSGGADPHQEVVRLGGRLPRVSPVARLRASVALTMLGLLTLAYGGWLMAVLASGG